MSRRVIFAKKKPQRPSSRRGGEPPLRENETLVDIPASELAARRAGRTTGMSLRQGPLPPRRGRLRFSSKRLIIHGSSLLAAGLLIGWLFDAYDLARHLQPAYATPAHQAPSGHISSPRYHGRSNTSSASGSAGATSDRPMPTDESFRATFNVHRKQGETGGAVRAPRRIEADGECVVTASATNGQLQGLDACLQGGS